MSRYVINHNGVYSSSLASLAGACIQAKSDARSHPGVKVVVHREEYDKTIEVARYHLDGRTMRAWVR